MEFILNLWDSFVGLVMSFQVADALDVILVSFYYLQGN